MLDKFTFSIGCLMIILIIASTIVGKRRLSIILSAVTAVGVFVLVILNKLLK